MAANFKAYRIRAMLECGHTVSHKVEYPFRVPPEYLLCPQCKTLVMAYAFETREWKSKCTKCRYSRWAGQSEENARTLANRHYVSTAHPMSVRYSVNPEIFEIIRHHYKRRFKFNIPDSPPRIPFPRVRETEEQKNQPPPF